MASAIELTNPQSPSPPRVAELKESVWQAWLAKGRERDRRGKVRRNNIARLGAAATLLVAATLGAQLAPYETVARFVVAAAAVAMTVEAVHARQYAFAVMFGVLAALYNPVIPVFEFTDSWERVLVAATAAPFLAPFIWANRKSSRRA